MITIKNDTLCVTVSETGAEVQSIKDVRTGREYLWQGDAQWWSGRSPLLFPIVGGLWNGTYRLDGREYKLPKHGFVRRAPWHVVSKSESSVRLEFRSTVGTFADFPFAFCLSVTYTIEGSRLTAAISVDNLSSREMFFQVGGHPALNLPGWNEAEPVDGYLRLEGKATHVVRAGEQGCQEEVTFPVPFNEDNLIPLSVETFCHEALIFNNNQISAATLLNKQKQPVARVESTAPVWLFWSPQGVHTPFICCEPWYGLCDRIGFEGDIAERPYINRVEANGQWTGGYTIEILLGAND